MSATVVACWAMLAQAGAPPGHFVAAADTVYDSKTHRTWQRGVSDGGVQLFSALTYCQNLAIADGGWRLPTPRELVSLVDVRAASPAIDVSAFPGTPSSQFWSVTPCAATPGANWSVGFVTGKTAETPSSTYCFVRCVR